jgi:hypothetical protein
VHMQSHVTGGVPDNHICVFGGAVQEVATGRRCGFSSVGLGKGDVTDGFKHSVVDYAGI